MSQLKLFVLGAPYVERAGQVLEIERRKVKALLIYLTVSGQLQQREKLATLFWPDSDQRRALGSLRRHLSEINKATQTEIVESNREEVWLKPTASIWLDVAAFEHCLTECQSHDHAPDALCTDCMAPLSHAAELYQDDFLAGFNLRDSPDFDDWQYFEGERLRQALAFVLARLVQGHSVRGEFDQAIPYARRWLALDPIHEPPHRHLMQLYAWANHQSAALRQYEQCTQMLTEEFGTPPSTELQELNAAIRSGRLPPPKIVKPVPRRETYHAPRIAEDNETTETPVENELRLVTVLCAGMVESESTLDGSPEQTAAHLTQLTDLLSPILDRYEARLERLLADSVLVLLGAEHVHEDDPERALRVALDLLEAAQDANLSVAIGVATGPVFVGQVGDQPGTHITGPVVMLATRLQGAAEVGEVLVSERLRHRTHHAFHLVHSPVRIRGLSGGVYQLIRPQRKPRKTRGIEGLRADLTGRDEELSKLVQATQRVQHEQGQMICLIGDAGVGKSRLVSELQLKFTPPILAQKSFVPSLL